MGLCERWQEGAGHSHPPLAGQKDDGRNLRRKEGEAKAAFLDFTNTM